MARNTKPEFNPTSCNFDVTKDFERTKPGLAITPEQVKEMTLRGIPVSAQNVGFIETSGNGSWTVDPQFRREMDMATAWQMEKESTRKVMQAMRQKKYGDKYINPQNN